MVTERMNKKTVTVFGLGFVGLTTALGFAETGCKVFGIDVDTERKGFLREGRVPFHEPHMEEVLRKHIPANLFLLRMISRRQSRKAPMYSIVWEHPTGRTGARI